MSDRFEDALSTLNCECSRTSLDVVKDYLRELKRERDEARELLREARVSVIQLIDYMRDSAMEDHIDVFQRTQVGLLARIDKALEVK